MLLKRHQAEEFTLAGGTSGAIYPSSPKGDYTVARVMAKGTYPERGYSMNQRCTETLYVLSGTICVEIDGQSFEVHPGDLCRIEPGRKYRITGDAEVLDLITPAWDRSQNSIVDG